MLAKTELINNNPSWLKCDHNQHFGIFLCKKITNFLKLLIKCVAKMIQHKLIYREVFSDIFMLIIVPLKMAKGNARLLNGEKSLSHNGKTVKTNSNKRPQTELCKP